MDEEEEKEPDVFEQMGADIIKRIFVAIGNDDSGKVKALLETLREIECY